MAKDECLVVDENDIITGTSNKHACHRFEPHQPKVGVLKLQKNWVHHVRTSSHWGTNLM